MIQNEILLVDNLYHGQTFSILSIYSYCPYLTFHCFSMPPNSKKKKKIRFVTFCLAIKPLKKIKSFFYRFEPRPKNHEEHANASSWVNKSQFYNHIHALYYILKIFSMDNSGQDGQPARLNEFLAGVNISRQYLKIKNNLPFWLAENF